LKQNSLFPKIKAETSSVTPEGLRYRPDFISEMEERELKALLADLRLKPFEFHGYLGKRRVLSFGVRYDYSSRLVELAAAPPAFLDVLRARVAEFAGRSPEEFRQFGINEYGPGAGIGWHKDKPEFGDVVGISLLSSVTMRFRKRSGQTWFRASQALEPRSIYVLSGEVRHEWEHSIAPVASLRYSIMFRTLALGTSRLPVVK
jgi:alkylated DNA repair dioxygenase AlkB